MNVFTYGSLMFPEVWLRVTGQPCPAQPATLKDFAAWRVKGESYPGLAAAPGHLTRGLVYGQVSLEAAARLDAFEGTFYRRTTVQVTLADLSQLSAETYLVGPEHHLQLEPTPWDAEEFRRFHLTRFIGPRRGS